MNGLKIRLDILAALPIERLDSLSLQKELRAIHKSE